MIQSMFYVVCDVYMDMKIWIYGASRMHSTLEFWLYVELSKSWAALLASLSPVPLKWAWIIYFSPTDRAKSKNPFI